jgi:hypothetical protein
MKVDYAAPVPSVGSRTLAVLTRWWGVQSSLAPSFDGEIEARPIHRGRRRVASRATDGLRERAASKLGVNRLGSESTGGRTNDLLLPGLLIQGGATAGGGMGWHSSIATRI